MPKYLKQILIAGVVVIALAAGIAAYNVFKAPAAASGPIEAIPIASTAASSSAVVATSAPAATAAAAEATSAPAATAAADSANDGKTVLVQILQAESEARFVIDEVLNDAPKTVIGATDQVAGQIAIDPSDPTSTQVGVIQVNARTLTTDNNFRNRAIQNQILQTDEYEFVTFTPTEVVGLPEAGAVGEPYSFQIVGDLTIRGVTRSVTFDVTAQAISDARVEGTATTAVSYADYGISIPQVPQVASVADQVRLEIDFVAAA
jgi:polyisoprenoid-binding protein YceI